MRKRAWFVILIALAGLASAADASPIAFVAGTWTGTSTCVGDRPACKNEIVVYRFMPVGGHPHQVRLYADKIIDGKRLPMGALIFEADDERHTVRGEFTRGHTHGEWSFAVSGNSMTGMLVTLPERSKARDVKAHRANDADLPPPPPLSDYEE